MKGLLFLFRAFAMVGMYIKKLYSFLVIYIVVTLVVKKIWHPGGHQLISCLIPGKTWHLKERRGALVG
jgi:hypothetical protein